MTNEEEDVFYGSLSMLVLYLMLNFFIGFFGLLDRAGDNGKRCDGPRVRIGYVLWGYRVGCWLGEEVP